MNEENKKINALLEQIAIKMNTSRPEVSKKLKVLDNELISILEFSLSEKVGNDDEWIKCSPNSLLALKPIMHPEWDEAYQPRRFKEAANDAKNGITFAFYWKECFLCWER